MPNDDIGPARIITVDDVPYVPYPTEGQDPSAAGVVFKQLAAADSGLQFVAFQMTPHLVAPPHWHDYDTVYLVKRGEFRVDGEGAYHPGDVRWVKGGTAYGSESTGAEGCEVYVISMGPIVIRDPFQEAPPNGWTDELIAAKGRPN